MFITLDGNGENREGFGAVLRTSESTPRILTVEMDADVALAQRLVYGEDILFSGAQRGFKYRSLLGGGSHVSTLEHLLLRSNRLITDETRAHVRVLYLDYCGGPVCNQTPEECVGNLERLFARLPRLEVFAVTMSKRHHPNLLDNFSVYVPTPHGFSVVETFVDNPKVVCKVYARNAQPRRLLIPGTWWNHSPKGSRKRKFEGTVTAYDGRTDRYPRAHRARGGPGGVRGDARGRGRALRRAGMRSRRHELGHVHRALEDALVRPREEVIPRLLGARVERGEVVDVRAVWLEEERARAAPPNSGQDHPAHGVDASQRGWASAATALADASHNHGVWFGARQNVTARRAAEPRVNSLRPRGTLDGIARNGWCSGVGPLRGGTSGMAATPATGRKPARRRGDWRQYAARLRGRTEWHRCGSARHAAASEPCAAHGERRRGGIWLTSTLETQN